MDPDDEGKTTVMSEQDVVKINDFIDKLACGGLTKEREIEKYYTKLFDIIKRNLEKKKNIDQVYVIIDGFYDYIDECDESVLGGIREFIDRLVYGYEERRRPVSRRLF